MAGVFGTLDVRLDPWQAEYGPELALQRDAETGEDAQTAQEVGLDVERAPDAWAPIAPGPLALPRRLVFIDGVRRAEARVVIRRADGLVHGVFGSYAVGHTDVEGRSARCGEPVIGRVLALGSGVTLPSDVEIASNLVYRPLSLESDEVDAPLKGIHGEMRNAEGRLATNLADREGTLCIMDGPLSFGQIVKGWAVGFIKRLHRLYLPPSHLALLARLDVGQRTPLFALRSQTRFSRYSWFSRLVVPRGAESDLAGIVRLEVSETIGAQNAVTIADAATVALPRFVPTRTRDPRAPANLLPIGALESHLRRRLGDQRLIRRHIERLVTSTLRPTGPRGASPWP